LFGALQMNFFKKAQDLASSETGNQGGQGQGQDSSDSQYGSGTGQQDDSQQLGGKKLSGCCTFRFPCTFYSRCTDDDENGCQVLLIPLRTRPLPRALTTAREAMVARAVTTDLATLLLLKALTTAPATVPVVVVVVARALTTARATVALVVAKALTTFRAMALAVVVARALTTARA
jgi:hypothetical protein